MEYTKGEHYVNIIDIAIQNIQEEEAQYREPLMEHLTGGIELGKDRFAYNHKQLVRCTTEIKVLKKVRCGMLGIAPETEIEPK